MRFFSLLVAVTACTDSWGHDITVSPASGPPLGVGLVQTYTVTQERCDGGVDGGSCDAAYPDAIDVSIGSGSGASLENVGSSTFDLLGVAEGSTTIHVIGESGATTDVPIEVAAVASTRLTIQLESGVELQSPVNAFTDTHLTIGQQNLGPGGAARAGEAPLAVTSGQPLVSLSGDGVTTGPHAGTVQIAAVAATLELDVVATNALADFTVDGSSAPDLVLYASTGTTTVDLVALAATGAPIVGGGPEPTFKIADPSIVGISGTTSDGNSRTLGLEPFAAGTTTIQLTWGQVTHTIGVSVLAR
jgi:hypothetical protein